MGMEETPRKRKRSSFRSFKRRFSFNRKKSSSKEEGVAVTPAREVMAHQFKGWLWEKSATTALRLSSKKWCVLDGYQLFVYDSCEEEKPVKVLNLPQFQVRMIVGDMDSEDDDDEDGSEGSNGGEGSNEETIKETQEQYFLELQRKQGNSRTGDVYLFAVKTEEEFNQWGKMLTMSSKIKKHSAPNALAITDNNNSGQLRTLSSPEDDVFHRDRSKTEPMLPQLESIPQLKVTQGSDSPVGSPSQRRHVLRTISMPFSPYTKEKAQFDFHKILQRADFTFWEEENEEGGKLLTPGKQSRSASTPALQPMETCLLAPSTKKSPGSTPTHSPPTPRRSDQRWSSLPADARSQLTPKTKRSKSTTNKSPNISPNISPSVSPTSLRKRVSKRLGGSWDRSSFGGSPKTSPKTSPRPNRKSCGFGNHLTAEDFNDSYGLFEMRSSQRLRHADGEVTMNGNFEGISQDNARPRSATISSTTSTSSEEQPGALKAPSAQFNRTLSFITRMKEANKRGKRKMRQIQISADDIVNPAKTGFVKISSKGKASSVKRCYAVLKDDWLYLYKKPSDTCTLDAYDMPSYTVSANVGSDSLRNFRNQKLSISLEHKVTGNVIVLTSEVGIEIFEWAEKLQKASKDQGLAMAGLNLEHGSGRPSSKPFISAPTMQSDESIDQSDLSKDDEQLAELHRHRLIQQAMKENQQLILGTQTLKEAPEQFPLGPSHSPSLQRKKEKLENKFQKASEEEEQQAMIDLTILKRRRISTQVKQDTILRQLEDRKQQRKKKKNKTEDQGELMRKQLDALNEKLSTINSEIQNKSQQKEHRLQVSHGPSRGRGREGEEDDQGELMRKQLDALNEKLSTITSEIQNISQQKEHRLQAIKERKVLELQVLEQQNQLLRYRKAAQNALENIMENAPVQRQSLAFLSEESSDGEERHTTSDTDSPREERSDSQLSAESVPGISLQRPSIDVGVPGPTVILQRSSVELQVGPDIKEETLQQSQSASVTQSPPSMRSPSPGNHSNKKGSPTSKRKKRLLPAIPGSPGSSRSNSPPSNSGSESDQELKITEAMEARGKNSEARLAVPGSGHSSPSESGSDSPKQQVRRNSTGRILPEIPSGQRRSSGSSMDIRSDDSLDIGEKPRNGGSDFVNVTRTKSNSLGNESLMNTSGDSLQESDANGNHVTSKTFFLRQNSDQGGKKKKKQRPMSEGGEMHRLSLPRGNKKKQRSASEGHGLRTEISEEVLTDIEDFERMARSALREAGWQIPI